MKFNETNVYIDGRGIEYSISPKPINKTYSEPVYPDLINIFYEKQLFQNLPDNIIKQINDYSLEQQGTSFGFEHEFLNNIGIDISSLSFDYEEYLKKNLVFDPLFYKDARKRLTTGRPPNNSEPYPVDEKIRELQEHLPFLKIHNMDYLNPNPNLIKLTKEVIQLSDSTEKRLVKLENVLSTVMRNLHRTASRMNINCVYYGGQNENRKYISIRCLHDDRISDGQCMSLDQCLSCTRYEPILGKVYDILDETGGNIDAILDDNQMSYSNMEEHINLNRIEKNNSKHDKAFLEPDKVEIKDELDYGFDEMWQDSKIMDWSLTPVEEQRPNINYEQEENRKSLSSSYLDAGFNTVNNINGYISNLKSTGNTNDIVELNEDAFANNTNPNLQVYINDGLRYANANTDASLKNMQSEGFEGLLRDICAQEGVDPLLILALIVVESQCRITPNNDAETFFNGLMQVPKNSMGDDYVRSAPLEKARRNILKGIEIWKQKISTIGSPNIMLGTVGYNAGEGMILGTSATDTLPVHDPGLDPTQKDSWSWTDIAINLERNVKNYYGHPDGANRTGESLSHTIFEKMTYYPRVHYVYRILLEKIGYSPFAGDQKTRYKHFVFPFHPEDISKLRFSSDFGARIHPMTGKAEGHNGIDLAGAEGISVLAAHSGTVEIVDYQFYRDDEDNPRGAGQYIRIFDDLGIRTTYMHLVRGSQRVKVGDRVRAGDHIANLGTSGGSTGPHLHFEVTNGPSRTTIEHGRTISHLVDPKIIFPFLNNFIGKQITL